MLLTRWRKKGALHEAFLGAAAPPRTPPVDTTPFTPAEWDEIQQENLSAARHMLGIIIGIVTSGLAGYIAIALSVKHGWW